MRKSLLLTTVAALAALLIQAGPDSSPVQAQGQPGAAAALTGQVSSAREGPMEGVVSALLQQLPFLSAHRGLRAWSR